MRPVSDLFLQALAGGHQSFTKVNVHSPDGSLLYGDLPITDGTVTIDRGSDCRYTCSLTVADGNDSLMPFSPTDLLAPYGNRLAIYMGMRYPDGSVESVPVGLYRIEEPTGDVDLGSISISGKGLECIVTDDKFTAPYSIVTNTDAAVACTGLLADPLPLAVLAATTAPTPLPTQTWDAGSDRWAAMKDCATAAAAEIFADAVGAWVLRPIPDVATAAPVWEVAAGTVLITSTWGLSRDGVYNGVLATGENTSDNTAPVAALVTDDDVTSPTYWGGNFGHSLYSFTSSLLTTTALAAGAARAKLLDLKAPTTTLELTAVPNPALEAGDCIRVINRDGRRDLHLVQSIGLSLTDAAMTIKTISRKDEESDDGS